MDLQFFLQEAEIKRLDGDFRSYQTTMEDEMRCIQDAISDSESKLRKEVAAAEVNFSRMFQRFN